ncbi:hypothetical protein MSG28_010120 [Choristoneura fumiferana]|uniref:Uncharacterized protein n=1 Tax=Choristoneura fumiferana TaxID=7141 RepID=A0ACC0KJV8_CHOFU|nr:hypothetical protein MSG28_010120 [Choristoneura fumiferana]
MLKESDGSNHTIAVIGIMVFLVALAINAIMDVLKVKEEEKERRKLNPSGERRQSLAEFANKKHFRRQSSKFGLQLFQIAESTPSNDEEKTSRRQSRPYTRGDSTNSYLSDRKTQPDSSTPTESTEPRLVKRQSVSKLFGARPVPMVRRSSFPALPLNPDVQALMLGHRQPSVDSDDEGDGKGRRLLRGEESEITDIYLKENLISRIPSDIGRLEHLESLYLSGNDITQLPREISKLRALKCLDVSGNRLRNIPDEIGDVRNLKFLILDENELSELPLRLAELRALRYLSVCGI